MSLSCLRSAEEGIRILVARHEERKERYDGSRETGRLYLLVSELEAFFEDVEFLLLTLDRLSYRHCDGLKLLSSMYDFVGCSSDSLLVRMFIHDNFPHSGVGPCLFLDTTFRYEICTLSAWMEVEEASFPVCENGTFDGGWEQRGRGRGRMGDVMVTEVRAHETVHMANLFGKVVVLLCLSNTGRNSACLPTSEGMGIGKRSLVLMCCEARNARYLDVAVKKVVEDPDIYMDRKRFKKQTPCRRLDLLSLPPSLSPNFPSFSPSAIRLERGCDLTLKKKLNGVWSVKVYRP